MEAGTASPATRSDPAREAWELLSRLFFLQRGRMLEAAAELDLAPQQLFALKHLDRSLPMGDLADALHCDNSNVTGIVDRLEQRGLVERRPAEHDRRVKLLVLTPEGGRVRRRVLDRLAEPPAGIRELSRADQRALRDVLRRALDE